MKFSEATDSAIRDAEEELHNERINTTEFLIRLGGSTERSLRKIELLKEFEEEEGNNAPEDFDDDDDTMIILIYVVRRFIKKIKISGV